METRLSLVARVVVGGLLVLESLAMLILAVFTAMIGSLAGALAIGVGGGSATEEQLTQGIAVMALTIASPFAVSAVLVVGGVLLLLRRRRGVVIATAIVALAAQIAFHLSTHEGFGAVALVPCALHLLAIAVAFAFVPSRVADAIAT